MPVSPCPICGYDAPAAPCAHCAGAPHEPSLGAQRRDGVADVLAGLQAPLRGLYFLASTRGTKRWLVPPFLITTALFAWAFVWLSGALSGWIDALRAQSEQGLEQMPTWARWLLSSGALWFLAHAGGFLVAFATLFFAGLFTFSIVYEALCGPFLDTVHARIEARWFGSDPRDRIRPPVEIATARVLGRAAIALALIAGAIVLGAFQTGAVRWSAWLAGPPLALLAVAAFDRTWGRWLAAFLAEQLATLWVSLVASLIALALLVLFLPLKFVPVAGWFLFAGAAGFATTLTLLDIPFTRRNWSLRQRLRFLTGNFGAVIAFGATSGLLFIVPVVGPVLLVPAASVGGLWLLCRLDKNPLRPLDRRAGGA
jgi:uncharacterized protein involved in cysteine biosynthesis